QVPANATVDAVVLANLTLTKNFDVNFGNIPATGTPILNPKGTGHTDVGTTNQVGVFSVTGSSSTQISVVYPATITLGNGTTTITFNTDLEGDVLTQSAAVGVASGTQVTMTSGAYKFWLGGNLGTLGDQATGIYASDNATNGGGDFTLTVEYY
ncbi:MAG: DUF4402 domain-containing protein, partial [Candidatus Marinimicrobia bacterium]|nr:DUF4402 domain-containing protein [Candidatus Neomarinimicrobiota bacterium]